MNARDYLIDLRLDYINNYLTTAKFAEHNGLTEDEARKLLDLTALIAGHPHPEA
jgi:hypothetical protein